MSKLSLTLNQARQLHLAAQGLGQARRKAASKQDVLDVIRAMGALQIDTISVVARSPYFVLWSRLGDYQMEWLDSLLEEGALFEYWAHEACFLPIEDFGLYRHRMLNPEAMGWKFNARWLRDNADAVKKLHEHVREFGPVRSADFERKDKGASGWWGWKPEKRSLEVLFTTGQLMIARRQSFQRVYDLTERVHPKWHDRHLPSLEQVQQRLLSKSVHALGIAKASWVADYFRCRKQVDAAHPEILLDSGELIACEVEGWTQPAYIHRDRLALAESAARGELKSTATVLLSPFDPVVWDRKRASELFGFDYVLECYTPAPKRRHGYFVLPILRRGVLVGRVDAKAHRAHGVFELKALHLEPGVRESDSLYSDLALAFQRCANWHGTPSLEIDNCSSKDLKRALKARFKP